MRSSVPAEAPLLRLALADGRPATLLVGEASTVLSVDDALVSSWDLAGRPYTLVRETGTYRRGLDGRLLWKREATAEGPRLRRRLSAAEGEPVVEAARLEAAAALSSLAGVAPVIPRDSDRTGPEAIHRLRTIVALDAAALRDDAARFLAASGARRHPAPDQYLVPRRARHRGLLLERLHVLPPLPRRPLPLEAPRRAARPPRGAARVLRPRDRPAPFCLPRRRERPLPRSRPPPAASGRSWPASYRARPLFSFLDAWTGQRKSPCRVARLRRARPEARLRGPRDGRAGPPRLAREARLAPGRCGPRRWAPRGRHRRGGDRPPGRRRRALRRGPRGENRRSSLRDAARPGGPRLLLRVRRRPRARVRPPRRRTRPTCSRSPPRATRELRQAILAALRPADPARPPRAATYDIREFVY